MKKALVVLLLLAFTAGGLFAQFSFTGLVQGGVAGRIVGDNDPVFGIMRRASAGDGVRIQLGVVANNEEGTAGLNFAFRADGIGPTTGGGFNNSRPTAQFRWGYGWVSGLDGMLTAMAGRFAGWEFDPYDTQAAQIGGFVDAFAVVGAIKPVDMLKIAYGVATNEGFSSGNWRVIHAIGVGIRVPDVLDVNIASRIGHKLTDVQASFRVNALDNIGLKFTAFALGLHDFGNVGAMTFFEEVNLNGLVDNLSINLLFLQSVNQKATSVKGTDLVFRGWLWASYAIGNIVPRLDVNYAMGTKYNWAMGLNENMGVFNGWSYDAFDYNKNYSYMTVGLSCQFRVTASRYFEIGYILGADMSNTWYNAFGGNKSGAMAHSFHASVVTSF